MPPELFGLLLLGALAWLWYDSLKARDAGIRAVRDACEAEALQLLDETVSIASLKPARNDEGRLLLRRVYDFEYTDTGDNRRRGSIVMLGQSVLVINIGLRLVPDDRTLH
jgi:hypothetical protein